MKIFNLAPLILQAKPCDDDQKHQQTVDAFATEVRLLDLDMDWPSFNAYDPGVLAWNAPAKDIVTTFRAAIHKDYPTLGDKDIDLLAREQMFSMIRPDQQQKLLQNRALENLSLSEIGDAIFERQKFAMDRLREPDQKGMTTERRNGNGQQAPP